jgi:serine/threonine protein kinase
MVREASHKGEDARAVQVFAEFLDKCLTIDPKKRMSAEEALAHPFMNLIQEKLIKS